MNNKQIDLQALEEINKILSKLPDDSCVRVAFYGCSDIAKENIEQNSAYSFKRHLDFLISQNKILKESVDYHLKHTEYYLKRINSLEESRDRYAENCNYLIGDIVRKEILISRYETRFKETDR